MKDLQYDQMNGEQEMVLANKDDSFEIPAVEQHLLHAEIELKSFDSVTGSKTSVPRLQSFYPAEFAKMESQGAFVGYSVNIVHEPAKEVRDTKRKKDVAADSDDSNAGGDSEKKISLLKTDAQKEKPISQLNKAELRAKYKELWEDDAPEDADNVTLREAIKEKLKPADSDDSNAGGE